MKPSRSWRVSEQYWVADDDEDAVDLAMVYVCVLCFGSFCVFVDCGRKVGAHRFRSGKPAKKNIPIIFQYVTYSTPT